MRTIENTAVLIICVQLCACANKGNDGTRLDAFFDGLQVTKKWHPGVHVNWETGESDGKPVSAMGHHTHCSAFVAAACERLGVYILRPPDHPQILLADAQRDWLQSRAGQKAGWKPLQSAPQAQSAANAGRLVIAIWKSPDPKLPGHVALVRPGNKSQPQLKEEGVDIIQAGLVNSSRTTLKTGFEHHPGAWEKNEIQFFEHSVAWDTVRSP